MRPEARVRGLLIRRKSRGRLAHRRWGGDRGRLGRHRGQRHGHPSRQRPRPVCAAGQDGPRPPSGASWKPAHLRHPRPGLGGPPRSVSRALGHATTGFTLDVYSHPSGEEELAAADRIGETFGPRAERPAPENRKNPGKSRGPRTLSDSGASRCSPYLRAVSASSRGQDLNL
jgi:hypothetical protein